MNKVIAIGVVAVFGVACIALVNGCQPNRLTPERVRAARDVEQKLAETEKEKQPQMEDEPKEPTTENSSPMDQVPPPETYDGGKGPEHATLTAPDTFKVRFVCSNGDFVVECHREWAPIGVDRFYNLVVQGFFNEARFFRVVPGFVVQFGINGDPALAAKWREATIQDEPVKKGNKKGTITFAKSQRPNSRTTQLFINLADNSPLDAQGFSAFGEVIQGMDVVEAITAKYGQQPDQMMIQQQGNEYLKANFPDMDYIKEARIVK